EPRTILPVLASLVGPRDWLLFSANLAPGNDYVAGLKAILPQYDNALTREWLWTLLLDLGFERSDGRMDFTLRNGPTSGRLKKISARLRLRRPCRIEVHGETFVFRKGDELEVFFSYRYTPELVRRALNGVGLSVQEQWITKSEEEGVFLCRRS